MIIHLSDCPPQAWKNGLGSTREIAVQMPTGSSHGFLWRVSIAEVTSAVAFSIFPGIDRVIALLAGPGFKMLLGTGQTHLLTTTFAPFAFPGETSVDVQLVAGPTRDFNLMVRRALGSGELQVWRGPTMHSIDAAAVLVYCARGVVETPDGALQAGDAWQPTDPRAKAVSLHTNAVALVARVERHAGRV